MRLVISRVLRSHLKRHVALRRNRAAATAAHHEPRHAHVLDCHVTERPQRRSRGCRARPPTGRKQVGRCAVADCAKPKRAKPASSRRRSQPGGWAMPITVPSLRRAPPLSSERPSCCCTIEINSTSAPAAGRTARPRSRPTRRHRPALLALSGSDPVLVSEGVGCNNKGLPDPSSRAPISRGTRGLEALLREQAAGPCRNPTVSDQRSMWGGPSLG